MSIQLAQQLMDEFAAGTGITGSAPPRRYLWTDAYAVCNYLGLHRLTGDDRYRMLAEKLIEQVHHVLGRHRADAPHQGWISGLQEQEGERHPTRGGLRIGKQRKERAPGQPLDSQLEWERDGQYFHYLTRWMHALNRAHQETGEQHDLEWAAELAVVAHRAFTCERSPGGPKRMVWKMSIDLSRPLVESMGHHDPLDGLITCLELRAEAGLTVEQQAEIDAAIGDFEEMCAGGNWATDDPLGIGGLLDGITRLLCTGIVRHSEYRELLLQLLHESELSLRAFSSSSSLKHPAEFRLAFRELGLSIGLRMLALSAPAGSRDPKVSGLISELLEYRWLADQIESCWIEPSHRSTRSWTDHGDINAVMLATSLAPQGCCGM